jgi:hypothetical protein
MSIVSSLPSSVDQSSPHFSNLDIEDLHSQLLEAAGPDNFLAQHLVDMGVYSGGYLDIRAFDERNSPEDETYATNLPTTPESTVFFGKDTGVLPLFTFMNNATMQRGNFSPKGDPDFSFVRPQAVEYVPVIPADYTTAIPSIFKQMDKELEAIMQDDGSGDSPGAVVSFRSSSKRTTRRPPSTRHPRTPPLRIVEGNVDENRSRAPRKRKSQSSPLCAAKKAKVAALASPSPKTPKRRRKTVARAAVREYMCPEEGCNMVCKRLGDLKRHRQSRAHRLPSFRCPAGCGKMFSRKDAAKRHSETDKCDMFLG